MKESKRNVERGRSVITHVLSAKQGFEPKAMYRKDVGWIGVDYGKPGDEKNNYSGGHGIAHIVAKHPGAVDGIVDVLQNGTAYKHPTERRKIILIKGRTAAVLSKKREGRLLITDFENVSDKQITLYTSKGIYHTKGEK